jgi:hypothetical protein
MFKNATKYNNIKVGTVLGLLFPTLVFTGAYLLNYDLFSTFSGYYSVKASIYTKLATLSLIPNLLMFFFFLQKNYLYTGRGILLATFIFAFIILGMYLLY